MAASGVERRPRRVLLARHAAGRRRPDRLRRDRPRHRHRRAGPPARPAGAGPPPRWAATEPGDGRRAADRLGAYGRYVATIVPHYGRPGRSGGRTPTSPLPIRAWQMWNEPNLPATGTAALGEELRDAAARARTELIAADPGRPHPRRPAERELEGARARSTTPAGGPFRRRGDSPVQRPRGERPEDRPVRPAHDAPRRRRAPPARADRGELELGQGPLDVQLRVGRVTERSQARQGAPGAARPGQAAPPPADPLALLVHVALARGRRRSRSPTRACAATAAAAALESPPAGPFSRAVRRLAALTSASTSAAVRSQVKPAARRGPASRSRSSPIAPRTASAIAAGSSGSTSSPRRRRPRAARRGPTRRPACRTPSPRARSARSPRRATAARTRARPA